MSNQQIKLLRLACVILGAVLVARAALLIAHFNAMGHARIPALPHWSQSPEAGITNSAGKPASLATTNKPGTNSTGSAPFAQAGTHLISTNVLGAPLLATIPSGTNQGSTNSPLFHAAGTNGVGANPPVAALAGTNNPGTNSATSGPGPVPGNRPPGMLPPGVSVPGPGGMRGGTPPRPLRPFSPAIQARIDKITQSEMLAPILRPPPMALLGIAGSNAFIRTPNGQTVMLKENAEADGIKLLLIGTNRVLVQQGADKKELLIFAGFGGATLLPK